jgi:drug/metabolite transporter (DMT)-like permease
VLSAAFLSVIIIWATTPLAIQWSSSDAGFLFGASARLVIAALLCLGLIIMFRLHLRHRMNDIRTYLVGGLGLWGATITVYWGAQLIPSGLVSVLYGFAPPITGLMAMYWLGERVFTAFRLLGLLFGLLGLVVIFHHSMDLGSGAVGGMLGVLLSVHIHSLTTVWVKRIGGHLSALETTTGTLLVAAPAFLITWLFFDGYWPVEIGKRTVWSIMYLAVFGSTLGLVLYFYVLKRVQASRMALVTLVAPIIALFLGQSVNSEVISLSEWGGSLVILLGLVCFQWGDRGWEIWLRRDSR